ncbi:MAG: hypothetical protein ABIQ30_03810 [Devosia sp.]
MKHVNDLEDDERDALHQVWASVMHPGFPTDDLGDPGARLKNKGWLYIQKIEGKNLFFLEDDAKLAAAMAWPNEH